MFGIVDRMRCPFGCKPVRIFPKKEAHRVMMLMLRHGGGVDGQAVGAVAEVCERLAGINIEVRVDEE